MNAALSLHATQQLSAGSMQRARLHAIPPVIDVPSTPPTLAEQLSQDQISEQYLLAWQAGDEEAGEAFYSQHQNQVSRLSLLRTRDKHAAEDLEQEVWLRVQKSLHTYQLGNSPFGWLHKIVLNTHLSLLRGGRTFFNKLLDSFGNDDLAQTRLERQPSADPTPEMELSQKQELDETLSALYAIPAKYSVVVYLRFYEGRSLEEVAGILNVRKGTVKSRLNRGRKMVRKRLNLPDDVEQGETP